MSRIVFPYAISFQENGRIEAFPAADIIVYGKQKHEIRAIFQVDSGATTSLMPAADAEALGLHLEAGKKFIVRGVAGQTMIGYRHSLTMQLGNIKLRAAVIFAQHNAVPRILGREDIFTRFGFLFDEAKHRIALLETGSERKVIDDLFL